MLFSDEQNSPAKTLVAELRDYPEWHRGRPAYGVWIVPVEDSALLDWIRSAQESLADLLHPSLRRKPHVTLFACGFAQTDRLYDDDFLPNQLALQIARLERAAGAACALPLGRVDSFASAAFVSVADPGGHLSVWRAALSEASQEMRWAPYVPHITLGLYRREIGADVVRRRLGALKMQVMSLNVSELHYATYCTGSQFSELKIQYRLSLSASRR